MSKTRRTIRARYVASIGLGLFLGAGSAVAAGLVGPNDIADDAIRSRHIKAGQVKTADLADGAVTAAKLRPGAVFTPLAIDLLQEPAGASGQPESTTTSDLATIDGLTLSATCHNTWDGMHGHTHLEVVASSTGANATLNLLSVRGSNATSAGWALNEAPITIIDVNVVGGQPAQVNGTIIYREDGPVAGSARVSSIPFNLYVENAQEVFGKCWTQGTVTRATERA